MARSSMGSPMQKIHVARQAMHLVILLNDSVDKDDGLSIDEEEEAIELEECAAVSITSPATHALKVNSGTLQRS